ncbi:MAG: hypothetical protein CMN30_12280 [Sandaracinus sp.]|nr:hypothetical protein [Sandaracinus sp.]
MTIAASFETILDRCLFTPREALQLEGREKEVKRSLKARLPIVKARTIGSCARGSTIRQTSDLDLLAVLSRDGVRRGGRRVRSSTVLGNVRLALSERYPSTAIGRDGQAVVVAFAEGTSVDVVPAVFAAPLPSGRPAYDIPDGRGGWMRTAPGSHNQYIADADARSGRHLRSVAKLFKYWRWTRSTPVPISSFHVGLLMASAQLCRVGTTNRYSFALTLERLASRRCAALDDPLAVSGRVPACNTPAKHRTALATVRTSARRAAAAIDAEHRGGQREARRLWGLVFNGRFPR